MPFKNRKLALILNIETATKNCSVSIAKDGETLALQELNDGNYSHAEKLHEFIETVLLKSAVKFTDLDAVAVSKGPGSYTGLRIGVSAAKGLCFALEIPLISVATLESLAQSITCSEGYKVPMLDARRMEVYSAVFDCDNSSVEAVSANIVTPETYASFLNKKTVYFLGDGAEKCKAVIQHKNAVFIDAKYPSAKEMSSISFKKFQQNNFEDVAYFEPFYLKDFVVLPPKK